MKSDVKKIEESINPGNYRVAYKINDNLIAVVKTDYYSNNPSGEKLIGHLQLQHVGIDLFIRDLTFTHSKPTKFDVTFSDGERSEQFYELYSGLPVPVSHDNFLNIPKCYEKVMLDFGKNFTTIFNNPKFKSKLDPHLHNYFSSLIPYLK